MNRKFMSSAGWGWCFDNLIYLNYWVAGGRWVDRIPTVEEASLKEEDKADCREKWRSKDRDRKRQRERDEGIKISLLRHLEHV